MLAKKQLDCTKSGVISFIMLDFINVIFLQSVDPLKIVNRGFATNSDNVYGLLVGVLLIATMALTFALNRSMIKVFAIKEEMAKLTQASEEIRVSIKEMSAELSSLKTVIIELKGYCKNNNN